MWDQNSHFSGCPPVSELQYSAVAATLTSQLLEALRLVALRRGELAADQVSASRVLPSGGLGEERMSLGHSP